MENSIQFKETKAFKCAIRSVIFGFLTAVLFVFSAVPSIIYAIKALGEAESYPCSKDIKTIKRIAWFGLILGLTGFAFSIYSIYIIIQLFVLEN
jgi:hypothetical protein